MSTPSGGTTSAGGTSGGISPGGGATPVIPLSLGAAPFDGQIDLNIVGYRADVGCAGVVYASVQVGLISTAFGTGVLTVKGTIDGRNWHSLGEPTITADGIYGPFYVGGLQRVCVEVTTAAAATALVSAHWAIWEKRT